MASYSGKIGNLLTNVLLVDKGGNDATGRRGGPAFLTIAAALAAAQSGDLVSVHPGTYDEANLVLPAGVHLRGLSERSATVRRAAAFADTTMVTMGDGSRLEDLQLSLTSAAHVFLRAVYFPGSSAVTAGMRRMLVTVDNSAASPAGTSNVYGVHADGTSAPPGDATMVRAVTVRVASTGGGAKRGFLVDGGTSLFVRDVNIKCTSAGGGSGTFLGIETNHAAAVFRGRLMRVEGTTADVSRTAGTLLIGSSDLVGPSANGLGFDTILLPNTFVFADAGALSPAATRFLRPGTATAATAEIFVRMAQKGLALNISVRALTGPGVGKTDTFTVRRNGIDTALAVSLTGTGTQAVNEAVSVAFTKGQSLSVKVVTASATATSDVVVTIEYF